MTLDSKGIEYYEGERPDFWEWIGGGYGRILDVGCGAGASAKWFRSHGAKHIVGVEIDAASAARARERMDVVICEPIEQALSSLQGPYDLVICGDVLEHLLDPWIVLDQLAHIAGGQAHLAVSVPNIRYRKSLLRLAFGAGFRYEEAGHFDSTHIRFFTRANLESMLCGAGWLPDRWGGPLPGWIDQSLASIGRGLFDEWLRYQWYVIAGRRDGPS